MRRPAQSNVPDVLPSFLNLPRRPPPPPVSPSPRPALPRTAAPAAGELTDAEYKTALDFKDSVFKNHVK